MIAALSLLTIVGRGRAPTSRALGWFPVVGLLVGAVVAVTYWGAHRWWSPMVAGGLVVLVDLTLTGAIHLDGAADSADGLLPHLSRQRRLEVMADPMVGTFGMATVVMALGLRWAALAQPSIEPIVIVSVWGMSRTVAALVPAIAGYARPGGLAQAYIDRPTRAVALWLVPLVALALFVSGGTNLFAVGAALVAGLGAAAGVVAMAVRRVGGYTGDVLGASIVVFETVALVVMVGQP